MRDVHVSVQFPLARVWLLAIQTLEPFLDHLNFFIGRRTDGVICNNLLLTCLFILVLGMSDQCSNTIHLFERNVVFKDFLQLTGMPLYVSRQLIIPSKLLRTKCTLMISAHVVSRPDSESSIIKVPWKKSHLTVPFAWFVMCLEYSELVVNCRGHSSHLNGMSPEVLRVILIPPTKGRNTGNSFFILHTRSQLWPVSEHE